MKIYTGKYQIRYAFLTWECEGLCCFFVFQWKSIFATIDGQLFSAKYSTAKGFSRNGIYHRIWEQFSRWPRVYAGVSFISLLLTVRILFCFYSLFCLQWYYIMLSNRFNGIKLHANNKYKLEWYIANQLPNVYDDILTKL